MLVRVGKLPEILSYDQIPSQLEDETRFDPGMVVPPLGYPYHLSSEISQSNPDYVDTITNPLHPDQNTRYVNVADPLRQRFQHSKSMSSQGVGCTLSQGPHLLDSVISWAPQNCPYGFPTDFRVAGLRESPFNFDNWEVY
jgi:hypothetical protein